MAGGVCGGGTCMSGGHACQGGMRVRGGAWQGACVGGMHDTHAPWQILRDTVNNQAVRMLLECILVD